MYIYIYTHIYAGQVLRLEAADPEHGQPGHEHEAAPLPRWQGESAKDKAAREAEEKAAEAEAKAAAVAAEAEERAEAAEQAGMCTYLNRCIGIGTHAGVHRHLGSRRVCMGFAAQGGGGATGAAPEAATAVLLTCCLLVARAMRCGYTHSHSCWGHVDCGYAHYRLQLGPCGLRLYSI